MKLMFGFLFGLWVGYQAGYYDAHLDVGRECQILGGFYIGKSFGRVEHYQCSLKDEK